MKILHSPSELVELRKSWLGKTVGFVPTMGALHEGHESLLRKSRDENEISVLSIFVNPTQFNKKEDFENYPLTWENDIALAEKNKVDVIFSPTYQMLYPDGFRYLVKEKEFSRLLCGEHRPGHFDGVLTVVLKFFNLVQPSKAYFGEKDFQQLSLISGMVQALFLPLEIVPVPTVREKNGLALSSRNLRLSIEEKQLAPRLHKIITSAKTVDEAKAELENAGFKVDYVSDIDQRRFAAAHLGSVRLIDNVEI